MAKYRVREGFTFGAFDQHKAGAMVELTELEAAGFLDKLESMGEAHSTMQAPEHTGAWASVESAETMPATKPAAIASVEKQLEQETGHDFIKTGDAPPTLAETNKPAPDKKK